jgi:translation initiation factor 5A
MLENGETREDLKLPETTDDLKKLAQQIKDTFEAGTDIFVTVVSAMGEEQIQGMKTLATNN